MPAYVADLPRLDLHNHEMLRRNKNPLHMEHAVAILRLADALRRTAFLDVSSLNFGDATSIAVFLWRLGATTRPDTTPSM